QVSCPSPVSTELHCTCSLHPIHQVVGLTSRDKGVQLYTVHLRTQHTTILQIIIQ
ncbi:hypothetical protein BgiMline_019592, partial [Biomphalaria glabrata]